MALDQQTRSSRTRARAGAAIAVAIGLMNVATYAYTMVAARWLGPQSYGAFAALMGLLLVLGVLQLGLQATGARRVAAAPAQVHRIERSVLAVGNRSAVALGAACLLCTPLIDRALRLHSAGTAALVAAAVVPMTLMGAQAGVLQGERRWVELAVLYLANGLPRLGIGTALIVARPTEMAAMVGVVLGQCAPVLVGWLALRRDHGRPEPGPPGREHAARSVLAETAHSSHALLAFFALSNVDVLVARSVLDGRDAGLYAAGLIVVKAVLFLPQFVVVLAFPSMSSESARRRVLLASLVAVACIGVACAVGARLLSSWALILIGGDEYAALEPGLWKFALVGTFLSMLQLLVYSVLARRARHSVYLVWAALAVVALAGQLVVGWASLLLLVLLTDTVLFVVLLGVSLWRLRVPAEGS